MASAAPDMRVDAWQDARAIFNACFSHFNFRGFFLEQLPVREAIAYRKDSAVEAAGAAPLVIFCCIYVRIADARETGRCKCRR